MAGLFYLLVCSMLLLLMIFQQHNRLIDWCFQTIAFGLILSFVWVTARWELLSLYVGYCLPVLFFVAAYLGYRRWRKTAKQQTDSVFGLVINGALIFIMLVMNVLALRGYRPPTDALSMASPLRGNYIILNGGGSPQINAHAKIAPQDYALDIVGINRLGRNKAIATSAAALNSYVIFEDSLFSPLSGTVLKVVDGFPDQVPPARDTVNLEGNYLIIAAGENKVVLAHLQAGTIVVTEGQEVTTGTYLGKIGNSGNSSEPHLHLHVEKGGVLTKPLTGKGVPIRINGQHLVRGSVLR